ncbi:MAG: class A beta-lactamase-related serine hydrolase [Intrasporangium sp.]|uniref:serine hydrolase n=1 Tax=Intrasporangium sp. TaxID=1925024 RepID=UPI002648DCE0|nr:serine hydrolase [Intrasporangium sp.]MDN5797925.1 class A beta-lactamase-related serine hydrolase [Intrasporangium sp.]
MSALTWSACVRDSSGMPLTSVRANVPLRSASVGKLLLLLHVARALSDGPLPPGEMLTREPVDAVADSGLWWYLSVDTLPVVDAAQLVGAVSDNLATNVLLRRVGLDAVAGTAAYLGLSRTALHDKVRDVRSPTDPPTLSTGTAGELSRLTHRIAAGAALGPEPDLQVEQWLSANVDLSMVGSAFVDRLGLDPLAHMDGPVRVFNKTGTDAGVRADVGAATFDGRTVAWAALANWSADDVSCERRLAVEALARMRQVGLEVLGHLAPGAVV